VFGVFSYITSRRSGSEKGRGVSKTAFTMEKIAVLAPMPKASVKMTMSENPGDLKMTRRVYRKSCIRWFIRGSLSGTAFSDNRHNANAMRRAPAIYSFATARS
jgi:hypothetical protein